MLHLALAVMPTVKHEIALFIHFKEIFYVEVTLNRLFFLVELYLLHHFEFGIVHAL